VQLTSLFCEVLNGEKRTLIFFCMVSSGIGLRVNSLFSL
jgi:hypothetical protein